MKSRLYNRPRGQAASFRRPRLLGGDPLARARLVERAALGISDERGYEQDNVSPSPHLTSNIWLHHLISLEWLEQCSPVIHSYLIGQMELRFTNIHSQGRIIEACEHRISGSRMCTPVDDEMRSKELSFESKFLRQLVSC